MSESTLDMSDITCGNCGFNGHYARNCKEPLTSYGIICYNEIANDEEFAIDESFHIKPKTRKYNIILVQRSHTIGYIEFLRGKYEPTNDAYIIQLFEMMSLEERGRIIEHQNFDTLRQLLGMPKKSSSYKNEYEDAKAKFNSLITKGSLLPLLQMSRPLWESPEWGLPKGRRQHHETDLTCGVREFYEETGLSPVDIQIHLNIQPLTEIYVGINGITYRHIYYFAKFIGGNTEIRVDPNNKIQTAEIRAIKWISADEVDSYIRNYHKEKATLIKDSFNMLKHSDNFTELIL